MLFALQLTKPFLLALVPVAAGGAWLLLGNTHKESVDFHERHIPEVEAVNSEEKQYVKVFAESFNESIPVESEQTTVKKEVKVKVVETKKEESPTYINEEIIEEDVPDAKPFLSNVVLYEGFNNGLGIIAKDKKGVKCKLSDVADIEQCSFSHVDSQENRGWINFQQLKNARFFTHLEPNFLSNPAQLYKVRVTKNFVDKWISNQNQNLEVYELFNDVPSSNTNRNATTLKLGEKPFLTLKPSFAFKDNNQHFGKSKFYVGKLKGFLNNQDKKDSTLTTNLELTNKWLNCVVPGESPKTQTCFIYNFDDENSKGTELSNKKLKKYPNKASQVEVGGYYIIKFLEPQALNKTQTQNSDSLKVEVYTNQARTNKAEVDFTFESLSNLVMHHEPWDKGVAIIL